MALLKKCSLFGVGRLELKVGLYMWVFSVRGAIQRHVLVNLLPVSMSLSMYLTSTPIPNFVNATSHPASHIFTTTEITVSILLTQVSRGSMVLPWVVVEGPGHPCVLNVPGRHLVV